ncbi:FtsK/SpoIIIE family DNA translocase [Spirosoma rhododendri]|uniref:DNA translocase FtsK n=1 Tax=Spirosoma rhododendri TaxID=2728024 RepID=A0A7L5DL86_9BACT|nr:DNA translocase FtsK [Spirosoma rhododendri]QJD78271.1 DNA translocase FtsK [Spirosoma rhododendri]
MAQPTTSRPVNPRPSPTNGTARQSRPTRPASPRPAFNIGASISRRLNDPRSILLTGVLLMLVAVGLLIAFVSYLTTGPADQSVVGSALSEPLAESGAETRNWAGLMGAYIAHVFVFRWFGVGALALPIVLLLAGLKLATGAEPFPLRRATIGLLFTALWSSLVIGYFVLVTNSAETASVWSGGIGYEFNSALYSLFGWGSLAFIGFGLFLFLVYFIDIRTIQLPSFSTDFFSRRSSAASDTDADSDTGTETTDQPVAATKPFYAQPEPFIDEEDDDDEPVATPAPASDPVVVQPVQTTESLPTTGVPLTVKSHVEPVTPTEPTELSATPAPTYEPDPFEEDDLVAQHGLYDSTLDLPQYQYPTNELLTEYQNNPRAQVSADELTANKERIENTLRNFGIRIDSIQASIGPTVTLYEIVPAEGVRISKIKSLEDDIALNLAALGIRIIAPMPGMGTIGIEVPNKNREMVSMRSVITSDIFSSSKFELPVVLGKTISNEIYVADLAKMPHLLMAGATGQGKSVGLNVLLTSLIYKKHPSQLKLVLVDPKKVELTLFNKLERHFLAKLPDSDEPIITDTKKVVNTLNSLCIEMDNRYNLLKEAGCRNLKEYNVKFTRRKLNPEKGHRYLPYIVLIIDELADLMMTAGKEVEQPIARLAQLARAIGIHLVVATQRPSVNVITGLIKANFPARLSFKVTSKIDSRTILDTGGAEQLVGMGDMLLSSNSDIIRLQCPFVDTDEIEGLCEFVGNQRGYDDAYALPEFVGDDGGQGEEKDVDLDNRDPMFDEAARLIVIHQQGSTSLIQRKLKLGYNRAGRLIDQLEAARIVGPFEGSKARDVLVLDLQALEEMLKRLKGE